MKDALFFAEEVKNYFFSITYKSIVSTGNFDN